MLIVNDNANVLKNIFAHALEKRFIAFVKLGQVFSSFTSKEPNQILELAVQQAKIHNGWFTEENIRIAIAALGQMLQEDKLKTWVERYPTIIKKKASSHRIAVIMAGNIPLVGFHDFLCVLITGNTFVGKLASDDAYLLPAVAKILVEIEPQFESAISLITTPIKSADAFIATGSNNSARYFEYYFGKHPHIIRKNRNAVAIIEGKESKKELSDLGTDIFQYFGLGCRNVSKIYVPENYKLDTFFEGIVDHGEVIHHNKYYNNHRYHHTIYLLNKEVFLDNNFLMLKESAQMASPVATLFYERYKYKEELIKKLTDQQNNIQCVVSSPSSSLSTLLDKKRISTVPFGQAQSPKLWEYADGVDTMQFLLSLK